MARPLAPRVHRSGRQHVPLLPWLSLLVLAVLCLIAVACDGDQAKGNADGRISTAAEGTGTTPVGSSALVVERRTAGDRKVVFQARAAASGNPVRLGAERRRSRG